MSRFFDGWWSSLALWRWHRSPPLPPPPTVRDLIGLVPGMTGERNAVEHVRWLRDDESAARSPSREQQP